jgi:hypothetical protein
VQEEAAVDSERHRTAARRPLAAAAAARLEEAGDEETSSHFKSFYSSPLTLGFELKLAACFFFHFSSLKKSCRVTFKSGPSINSIFRF